MVAALGSARRIVVKIGSALLVGDDGAIRRGWLTALTSDVAALGGDGRQIIIVASGAVALGAQRLGLPAGGRRSLDDAQAAAAAGQIELSAIFAELLSAHGLCAAQMLLTSDDLQDRRRYLNASATLERLVGLGAVPVINENDSVATTEIRYGDNDRLAARVAQAGQADLVLLLSNVSGLYAADPANGPPGEPIAEVPDITALDVALGPSRGPGSGGMAAKIEAARIAVAGGIPLVIADGRADHALLRFAQTGGGTRFPAAGGVAARKAWIAGHVGTKGKIAIDDGARRALVHGNSLLAAGVTAIAGDFERGDAVDIVGGGGRVVARGLISYDAAEAAVIAGRRNDEQEALLGYAPRSALVHRNNMVLL